MTALNPRKTYQNLKKKGFTDSKHKSKDHKYIELKHNGKHILHTKISHGNEDIREKLIHAMSFQCKLSKSELLDLAKCPMNKEEYIELLRQKGFID